jgi:hypothetical protein
LDWFTNNLLPEIPKGYTGIMDNSAFHPKEKSWANMKRYIRGNIQHYRSLDSAVYDYHGFSTS